MAIKKLIILCLVFGVLGYTKTIQSLDDASTLVGSEYLVVDQVVSSSTSGYSTRKITANDFLKEVGINKTVTQNTAASNTSTVIDNINITSSAGEKSTFKVIISGTSPNEFTYSEHLVTKYNAEDSVEFKLLVAVNSDETKLLDPLLSYDTSDDQVDITQQVVASNDGSVEWRVKLDLLVGGVTTEPYF